MITSWEFFARSRLPVIVYGMGNGGDKVIEAFEARGIPVADVIASDDFVRGQSFRGYRVKTLSEAEELYGDFVIAQAFASSLPKVTEHIRCVSQRHRLLVPSVPVYGENIFDRGFARLHSAEIETAYNMLADEKSKSVYKNIISFLLTGELEPLFAAESEKTEAFENILKLVCDESYLDLGAYRGDTIEEFLRFSGNTVPPAENFGGKITALEPNEKNFKKLSAFAGGFANTSLLQKGVWSSDGALPFSSGSGRGSAAGGGGALTEVVSVDSLTLHSGRTPTYIKADVEGAEFEMLCGAENTLKRFKPKLNIALYHRAEDIFRLILKVHEINPEYSLHIRHHPYIPFWDTNLYAL